MVTALAIFDRFARTLKTMFTLMFIDNGKFSNTF